MAQITSGIRSILSHPAMYNFTQNFLGVRKARRILTSEYFPNKKGLRILDIGCGTAEILEFLPEDIHYVGFDASMQYIEQARQRFGNRGEFFSELVNSAHLNHLGKFDVVLAFGVLHHLDDPETAMLFDLAVEALDHNGSVITVDPCFCPEQSAIARWLIEHDRGQDVRNENGYCQLASTHFSNITSTLRHDLLRVPYTYLIMNCKNEAEQSATSDASEHQ
ncbi:bifunctional 3-demethylubiquinone-9 3-methyltransferase/ 2-octaprenyl-6-hydroxy phenol methylase [Mariprofundus micogutta]|uniref:Bifunctional 3-demethylubiquinone-9 3-methyltransferase/ 2-octaprenyl-6-hydroxy phenol methylase n=1 Tax=Mariprofundus micogutta TaxID=1921010 RepID=A0A1L8CN15_9PROT|nr:class I SAM-dependent methyltransferase [Mariprofundus micogutta]GAV20305.1 bifunctional 3-demethylubiquinone-9 3-methyltransferase/ 2-octaprenyl-6-hydroxy phenol methylase [Mariprofundus micogutta]